MQSFALFLDIRLHRFVRIGPRAFCCTDLKLLILFKLKPNHYLSNQHPCTACVWGCINIRARERVQSIVHDQTLKQHWSILLRPDSPAQ